MGNRLCHGRGEIFRDRVGIDDLDTPHGDARGELEAELLPESESRREIHLVTGGRCQTRGLA